MYFKPFICWIFVVLFSFVSSNHNFGSDYQKYTFYYETYEYQLHPENELDSNDLINNIENNEYNQSQAQLPQISNESYSDTDTTFDISFDIENISISILKSSGRPFIININENTHENVKENINTNKLEDAISINYDNDDEFNSIEIWYTPHRQRRRLRLCRTTHSWWWGRWTHHHDRWCAPIAPPAHDAYWNSRWNRNGRFFAFYPGRHWMRYYHYWGCAHHCAYHGGGLASIFSKHENDQAKAACWNVLIHPGAKNQRDYSGHWRGHSCYIGLVRPFKTWIDRKKVSFTWWYPGEPNNWGGNEPCTEMYIWHDGRWNDIACHAKRVCVCQDPRGIVHGKYVGVQTMKPYDQAQLYCNVHYGTETATVVSDEDNKAAKKLCEKICLKHTACQCWIGLKYPFTEWEDGTNAEEKYTNWWPAKPWHGSYHQCTELVTWNPWNGKWNNLHCNYRRYVLCNVQTSIERMDYHEREEMISKRMQRHKMRWEKFQDEARRRKIRKEFFEKMKAQRAEMRKQRREQQQRMRDYYRQMAFNSAMSNAQSGGFGGGHGGGGGFGGGGYGAFGGRSVFYGDTYDRKRRLRAWIEKNSDKGQRRTDLRAQSAAMKRRKKEVFKKDKKRIRDTDEGALFYDRVYGLDLGFDAELKRAEENVNPTPLRCVMVKYVKYEIDVKNLYELCVNDDMVQVSKYMKKVSKYDDDDEDNDPYQYDAFDSLDMDDDHKQNEFEGQQQEEYEVIDFEQYEQFRYGQAIHINNNEDMNTTLSVSQVGRVQYLRINEFIYDHENNHKKQCYEDDEKQYEICLEFRENEDEMFLSVEQYSVYVKTSHEHNSISFENDKVWNKVNHIHGKIDKIEKCVNYFQRKICVFKLLKKSIHNQNSAYSEFNEYRIIIMKQMKQMDDKTDEYVQMVKTYQDQNPNQQFEH